MPSFDVVVETSLPEVVNAVDQVQREITTRYDFKGSKSSIEQKEHDLIILADDKMKLSAMQEILKLKLSKRGISLKSVKFEDEAAAGGNMLRQVVKVKSCLSSDELKRLSKLVKDLKLKVQASIQGEQLRVTGKKRDDLQDAIQALKANIDDLELVFTNFRD